jgi:hypothetical protein
MLRSQHDRQYAVRPSQVCRIVAAEFQGGVGVVDRSEHLPSPGDVNRPEIVLAVH